jgi:CheY-like chemotaxis protein
VTAAGTGPDALAALEAGTAFDLVILDLNMPGMNGVETLNGIRRLRPGLPVLLATGFLDETTSDLLRQDGRALSLHKPFSKAQLAQKLVEIEAF